eukprot:3975643-Alexandrium_andersonii.AAC.1
MQWSACVLGECGGVSSEIEVYDGGGRVNPWAAQLFEDLKALQVVEQGWDLWDLAGGTVAGVVGECREDFIAFDLAVLRSHF